MTKVIYNVGNMVNIPSEESTAWHKSRNKILFVGKMSYEPNIVAVIYFSTQILPFLKKQFPDITLTIIGADPDERVKKLVDIDGVEVTGFVDSVEPYFQDSTIVVAPMLTGAGIQNKIIQAMSYGCCVATSSIGAEGLNIENFEVAIYNTQEEWILGIKKLLLDSNLRKEMGNKARKYVMTHLSRDVIATQFWNFINSVRKGT